VEKIGKKKKQKTVTFRIDEDILDQLYDEINSNSISLNSIINSILRHIEWGRYEKKSNMMPIFSPVVREIFDYLHKDQIIYLARGAAKDAVYNIILFMYGSIDFDTLMCWFKARMKNAADVSDKMDENNGCRKIIFRHELGENWSLYNKVLIESICHDILSKPIKIDIIPF
jgi:hypothetical protein